MRERVRDRERERERDKHTHTERERERERETDRERGRDERSLTVCQGSFNFTMTSIRLVIIEQRGLLVWERGCPRITNNTARDQNKHTVH